VAVDFCAICKVLEDVVAQGSIGLRTLAPRERSRSNVACQCRFRASPSGRPTPRLFCLRLCVRLLGRPSGAGRHPDTTRSEWRRHRGKPEPKKHAVHALVERGGRVSARHIPDVTAKTLRATLEKIAAECFLSEYCAAGLVDWVGKGFAQRIVPTSVKYDDPGFCLSFYLLENGVQLDQCEFDVPWMR